MSTLDYKSDITFAHSEPQTISECCRYGAHNLCSVPCHCSHHFEEKKEDQKR
jgi:hypothetical protein